MDVAKHGMAPSAAAGALLLAALAITGPAAGCSRTRSDSPPARLAPSDPAKATGDQVTIGERMAIRSAVLGEDRVVLVFRPPGERDDWRYPVIYLLDGEFHFHHVTGLVSFLVQEGRIPRAMVVGLGNVDRVRDFTPAHHDDEPTSGGADRFLTFLEKELIPAIEASYPTAPYRILIGHSLGGLFAIHTLNQRPDLFDAAIGISPSLGWVGDSIRAQTESLLAARPSLDRTLYVAVGDEPGRMIDSNRAYAAMLRARAPGGLRWLFEEMPAEDHGSIVHRAVYRGLEHVFAGWRPAATPATLAELDAHYRALTTRFHVAAVAPEEMVNTLGYRLLAAGKTDDAVAAFRRNIELHPASANVYDSLGEALEKKGDLGPAIQNYELAVKNAALTADPLLEQYKIRLDRARAKR